MRQRFTYDCVLIKEDDGYCASFPQIPGALADGDTREEAIAHATEALMAFLAVFRQEDLSKKSIGN